MKHVYNYFDHIRAINVGTTTEERIKFTLKQLEKCPEVDINSFIDIYRKTITCFFTNKNMPAI